MHSHTISSRFSGTLQAVLLLYVMTLAAQLFSLAFGRVDDQQPFIGMILPSVLFLTAITLPACLFGIHFGSRLGLGAPVLVKILNGQDGGWRDLWYGVKWIIPLAVLIGASLLLLREATAAYLPLEIKDYGHRGVLGGLAVSLGAAVGEEVWFRLGLMTFVVWGMTKLTKQRSTDKLIWFTIVFSAIAFAAAHIPQLINYGAASPFALAGTMFGNIVVGVFFGWSYWRKGILAAMVAHFTVDLVIHVLPAVF